MIFEKLEDLIGNTRMLRYDDIYLKLEFDNIGFSIKDRVAKYILEQAEKTGKLKKGDVIIEYSSGNLGIGLALLAAQRGHEFICVAESSISEEKLKTLKALGANVVIADYYAESQSDQSMKSIARKIHESIPNSYFVNQFENEWNPKAHELYTAPEIHKDLPDVAAVFIGMGTGGIVSGIGAYFKKFKPDTKIIGVTPDSGKLYSAFHHLKRSFKETDTLIEGVGEDFVSPVLNFEVIDDVVEVSDFNAIHEAKLFAKKGLLLGSSTGMLLSAAKKYFIEGPKVVIVGDTGLRYLNSVFNDSWLKSKGYDLFDGPNKHLSDILKNLTLSLQKGDYPKLLS